jgi:hypothetical protein
MRRRKRPSSKYRPKRSPIAMDSNSATASASSSKSYGKGNVFLYGRLPVRLAPLSQPYGKRLMPHEPEGMRRRVKSKHLNVALWVTIALVVALIGAWTIWASRQADLRSLWAPD